MLPNSVVAFASVFIGEVHFNALADALNRLNPYPTFEARIYDLHFTKTYKDVIKEVYTTCSFWGDYDAAVLVYGLPFLVTRRYSFHTPLKDAAVPWYL